MAVSAVAERIGRRLQATGLNANAAALKAGLPRDAVRDILAGKSRNPRADTLMKIARALECDPAYLLSDGTEASFADAASGLPVRHVAAAGAWLASDDIDQDEPELVRVLSFPRYEAFPQWLERVAGDSMDRLIPPGALVHVVDAADMGYAPRHGDVVVVVRSRAQGAFLERTVKQVELLPGGGVQLWPRSHNPRWQRPLSLTEGVGEHEDLTVAVAAKVLHAYVGFG